MASRNRVFEDFSNIFRSFDNLFQSALEGVGMNRPGSYPPVECGREDNEWVFRAELPGVKPDDVEVAVEGNQLIIRGNKQHGREREDKNYYLKETYVGQFERSFTLPEGAKADQVKATHSNGVLEIRIPTKELAASGRKIPIEFREGQPVPPGKKPQG